MHILELYQKAQREEIDHTFLLGVLRDYKQPRMKICRWLTNKKLIRVKKGLYVFNPEVVKAPYQQAVLANWIYGPSALSLHFALSFYGFIPEHVVELTSVTPKKNKTFHTSAGRFTYRHQHLECYQVGLTIIEDSKTQKFIMATPEKAVADFLTLATPKLESREELVEYLENDMQFDMDELKALSRENFLSLQAHYKHQHLKFLLEWLAS